MTRNEYIASIMLEAAELLNETSKTTKDKKRNFGEYYYKRRIADADKDMDKASLRYVRANDEKEKRRAESNYLKAQGKRYGWEDDYEDYKRKDPEEKARYSRVLIKSPHTTGRPITVHDKPIWKTNHNAYKKGLGPDGRALKEAIDIFYDYAANCNTLDEAVEYINKAEELERVLYEDYE